MPASLRFLDDDETTVLTADDHGNVETPATSTPLKRFIENSGDSDADTLTVAITQVGNNDGDDYAQLALDSGGVPGTWGSSTLSLGTLIAGSKVAFWVRENVPAGRTADNNPRRYDLSATAKST